jgi:hypothetical protein
VKTRLNVVVGLHRREPDLNGRRGESGFAETGGDRARHRGTSF